MRMWTMREGSLYIIPGQFDILHPSITKIELQLHEDSDVEKYVNNFHHLESELNNILSYKDKLATIHITPRMTVYPPIEMCLPEFDNNIRSKIRIINILDKSIRKYYHNHFWIWFSKQLQSVNFDIQQINILKFYQELTGPVNMDPNQFYLQNNNDIKPHTTLDDMKKWVQFITKLPPNPMINLSSTIITQIDQLFDEMLHDKFTVML